MFNFSTKIDFIWLHSELYIKDSKIELLAALKK